MADFEIDYSYTIREGGSIILPAASAADAELEGLKYVHETFDDVDDVEIDGIREITPPKVIL